MKYPPHWIKPDLTDEQIVKAAYSGNQFAREAMILREQIRKLKELLHNEE